MVSTYCIKKLPNSYLLKLVNIFTCFFHGIDNYNIFLYFYISRKTRKKGWGYKTSNMCFENTRHFCFIMHMLKMSRYSNSLIPKDKKTFIQVPWNFWHVRDYTKVSCNFKIQILSFMIQTLFAHILGDSIYLSKYALKGYGP